jgi:hypothetical protein
MSPVHLEYVDCEMRRSNEDAPLAWEGGMTKRLMWAMAGAVAIFGGLIAAKTSVAQVLGATMERVDISVHPAVGNRLTACRLTGQVISWVRRPVDVLDDMRQNIGTIEAGLAQFGRGSKLEGCVPESTFLDLSDQFANLVIADDRGPENTALRRREAEAIASQLAQGFYHLAEREGEPIPLVNALKVNALGSVSYEFMIVLIRSAGSGAFDAVIHRETLRTKFAGRLGEHDRRLSRLKWSSIQTVFNKRGTTFSEFPRCAGSLLAHCSLIACALAPAGPESPASAPEIFAARALQLWMFPPPTCHQCRCAAS